jgi:hypothetical protein
VLADSPHTTQTRREATHLHYCIIGHQDLSTAVELFLFLISWALSYLVPSVTHFELLLASLCECLGADCSPVLPQHSHDKKSSERYVQFHLLAERLGVDARHLIYHMHSPAFRPVETLVSWGTTLARGTHGTGRGNHHRKQLSDSQTHRSAATSSSPSSSIIKLI